MFQYYNANPLGRHVNDCAIRAISLAEDKSWDDTYIQLSEFARQEAITLSEIEFIDSYLADRYTRYCQDKNIITVGDFANLNLKGKWLITMRGHITTIIDGIIYDTFDPSDRYLWCAYRVE